MGPVGALGVMRFGVNKITIPGAPGTIGSATAQRELMISA